MDWTLMRRLSLIVLLLAVTMLPARAEERLNIVASFSILGDFVKNVGGNSVNVTTLVGPNSDAHVYSPSPADAKKIADAKLAKNRRKVISTHAAFGYFTAAYGIQFIAPLGVSTESEPSARDIAGIITQVKSAKIPAVFLENISDPRLIQRISAETGARVGGTLYSDGLTGEKGDAPTYIDMVRHNIKALTRALGD